MRLCTLPAKDEDRSTEMSMSGSEADIRKVLAGCRPEQIRWGYPLARLTTLRVGGPAAAAVFPASVSDTVGIIQALRQAGVPWRVIGRGSNLLASDRGFPGVVVVLGSALAGVKRLEARGDEVLVRAEAGCGLPGLVAWCTAQELAGLEFAVGIPASVGGGVVMNAGAWGREMAHVLAEVTVLLPGGEVVRQETHARHFVYRRWLGREKSVVVLAALFRLKPGIRGKIEEKCRELLAQRRGKQPQGQPSAGSFFKNPPGEAAGRLIEAAGLKGCRRGGAMVSPVHANFLVNTGRATARDFLELLRFVQQEVHHRTSCWLEPEVELLGEWGPDDLL